MLQFTAHGADPMKRSTVVVPLILCCLIAGATLTGGAATTDQDIRILERKVERLEKGVSDLVKSVRALDKALVTVSKEASAVRKAAKALDDRSTERELLLAEWFDKFHSRSDGRFHRAAVRRIR